MRPIRLREMSASSIFPANTLAEDRRHRNLAIHVAARKLVMASLREELHRLDVTLDGVRTA